MTMDRLRRTKPVALTALPDATSNGYLITKGRQSQGSGLQQAESKLLLCWQNAQFHFFSGMEGMTGEKPSDPSATLLPSCHCNAPRAAAMLQTLMPVEQFCKNRFNIKNTELIIDDRLTSSEHCSTHPIQTVHRNTQNAWFKALKLLSNHSTGTCRKSLRLQTES